MPQEASILVLGSQTLPQQKKRPNGHFKTSAEESRLEPRRFFPTQRHDTESKINELQVVRVLPRIHEVFKFDVLSRQQKHKKTNYHTVKSPVFWTQPDSRRKTLLPGNAMHNTMAVDVIPREKKNNWIVGVCEKEENHNCVIHKNEISKRAWCFQWGFPSTFILTKHLWIIS